MQITNYNSINPFTKQNNFINKSHAIANKLQTENRFKTSVK